MKKSIRIWNTYAKLQVNYPNKDEDDYDYVECHIHLDTERIAIQSTASLGVKGIIALRQCLSVAEEILEYGLDTTINTNHIDVVSDKRTVGE